MFSAATGRLMKADEPWHPGIGDPGAVGWCIVGAYAVAVGAAMWAFVATRRGRRLVEPIDPQEWGDQQLLGRVWLVAAGVMLVLGVNKQLDLQTFVVQTMRRRAYEDGWYEERRRYQVLFGGLVLVGGLAAAWLLANVVRRVLPRVRVAVVGLVTLIVFVAVRAAAFHFGATINVILELGGIALVVVGVVQWQRRNRERLAACADAHSSTRRTFTRTRSSARC